MAIQTPLTKEFYGTRFYRAWYNMKTRCNNKKYNEFSSYGGRGIRYCDRWEQFKNFHEDMISGYADGLQLDRINNDGDYDKDNCRWVSRIQQMNNTSYNRMFTINNITDTFSNWVRRVGAKRSTVAQRFYSYGWSIEKALGLEV
jgi:hypothetical protein